VSKIQYNVTFPFLCEHFLRDISTKILHVFLVMWTDGRLLSFLCYNTLAIMQYVFLDHRKRKFKRMAVDPVEVDNPSTSRATVTVIPFSNGKKKRVVKHSPNCENK